MTKPTKTNRNNNINIIVKYSRQEVHKLSVKRDSLHQLTFNNCGKFRKFLEKIVLQAFDAF